MSTLPTPSPRWLAYAANRSRWAPVGPWSSEPDTALWLTAARLPGAVVRHPSMGHLCGYVAVPRGHRVYGMTDAQILMHDHGRRAGGIAGTCEVTFSEPGSRFLATEESLDADGWWWIGFACATADDGDPTGGSAGPDGIPWTRSQVYRTLVEVKGWVEELAEGVAAASRTLKASHST